MKRSESPRSRFPKRFGSGSTLKRWIRIVTSKKLSVERLSPISQASRKERSNEDRSGSPQCTEHHDEPNHSTYKGGQMAIKIITRRLGKIRAQADGSYLVKIRGQESKRFSEKEVAEAYLEKHGEKRYDV